MPCSSHIYQSNGAIIPARNSWLHQLFHLLGVKIPGKGMSAVLVNRDIPVHQGRDIRNLVRGSGENGLKAEAPQQMDALLDAFPVHLAECLVQDNDPDGIVLAAVPDAADLGKGGQQRDIERNLGFSAGLF